MIIIAAWHISGWILRSREKAGGIPVILLPLEDKTSILNIIRRLDGVILTGGPDIDPVYFENPQNSTWVEFVLGETSLRLLRRERVH